MSTTFNSPICPRLYPLCPHLRSCAYEPNAFQDKAEHNTNRRVRTNEDCARAFYLYQQVLCSANSQAIRLAQFMSQFMNYKFCYRSCNPHQTCQKMKIYKAVPLERFEQLLLLDNSPWRGFILEVRGTLYDLDYSIL